MGALNVILSRNAYGRLCLSLADGVMHEGVTPVRAFPIAASDEGISLLNAEGKEVFWIAHLNDVPAAMRQLLEEDFAVREFIPELLCIESMDSVSVPSTWSVMTDKGNVQLVLKAEEDIRKLEGRHHLLITSRDGVQYRIRDARMLDKHSQKILDRFL